jgi:hypothetical protein
MNWEKMGRDMYRDMFERGCKAVDNTNWELIDVAVNGSTVVCEFYETGTFNRPQYGLGAPRPWQTTVARHWREAAVRSRTAGLTPASECDHQRPGSPYQISAPESVMRRSDNDQPTAALTDVWQPRLIKRPVPTCLGPFTAAGVWPSRVRTVHGRSPETQNWPFCAAQPRRTRLRHAAHSRQGGCG